MNDSLIGRDGSSIRGRIACLSVCVVTCSCSGSIEMEDVAKRKCASSWVSLSESDTKNTRDFERKITLIDKIRNGVWGFLLVCSGERELILGEGEKFGSFWLGYSWVFGFKFTSKDV